MKDKTKQILKICAAFLAGVLLFGVFLHLGGNDLETSYFSKDRNSDNLIKVDATYIKTGTNSKGVEWKVSDDGTIKLYGTATSTDSVLIQTVDLEAGTYTYSVGNDKVNVDEFYSYAIANGTEYIAGTEGDTFELIEAATVQIFISWVVDVDFGDVLGTTFRPVLVEGENVGSFYAD